VLYFTVSVIACVLAYNIMFGFSYMLLYLGITYVVIVFLFLYLNTIIKKKA
jgi:hypothetical protein